MLCPAHALLNASRSPWIRAISYHVAVLALRGTFTVRTVFERAWHLHDTEDCVLTIATASYDGPLTVRVAGPLPLIHPGRRARILGGALSTGNLMLSLDGAARWPDLRATPPPLLLPALHDDLRSLDATFASHEVAGPLSPWSDQVASRTADLRAALMAGHADAAATAAITLLGLGPGLTPAGDDILVGLLAGLHILAQRCGRQETGALAAHIERAARTRTTPLSHTLLDWAGRGVAAQPLLDVLWSLGSESGMRALDALLAIGHTSGRDMLEGASLAASVILAREETDGPSLAGPPQRLSRLGEADARLGGAQ